MLDGTSLADAYTTITQSLNINNEANVHHTLETAKESVRDQEMQPRIRVHVQENDAQSRPVERTRVLREPRQIQTFVNETAIPIKTEPMPEMRQMTYPTQQQQQQQVVYPQSTVQQKTTYESPKESQLTYFDNIITKRKDVLKVIIFATSIILAISIHSCVQFWLQEVSIKKEFGFREELGLRVLYPVMVLVLIWLFKALN